MGSSSNSNELRATGKKETEMIFDFEHMGFRVKAIVYGYTIPRLKKGHELKGIIWASKLDTTKAIERYVDSQIEESFVRSQSFPDF